MMKKLKALRSLAAIATLLYAVMFLGGCAGGGDSGVGGTAGFNRPGTEAAAITSSRARRSSPSPSSPELRPGLGTTFGEERTSPVGYADFVRADGNRPLATTALYYDDAAGVRAQAAALGGPEGSFARPPAPARGLITLTVRDGASGFALRTVEAGGRRLVVGEPGRRYVLEVRNRTDVRLEIILSVDGLDVLDSRPASYRKPGYVVPPRGQLRVEGFRQSLGTVAAFQFGSVRDSYAAQSGQGTRNVGVVGAAVFGERGRLPGGYLDAETERRRRADPFPARGPFAEPPRRY